MDRRVGVCSSIGSKGSNISRRSLNIFFLTLSFSLHQLLKAANGFIPHRGLVETGQNPQRMDDDAQLGIPIAELLQLQKALCDFDQEIVIFVHLLDDLDQIRYDFVPNSGVA